MSNSVLRRGKDRDAPRARARPRPCPPARAPVILQRVRAFRSVRRPGLVARRPARHRRWRCCCCSRPPSYATPPTEPPSARASIATQSAWPRAGAAATTLAASLFYALTHSVTAKLREQSCSYGSRPCLTLTSDLHTTCMHQLDGHTGRPRPFVASKKGSIELREGRKDTRTRERERERERVREWESSAVRSAVQPWP